MWMDRWTAADVKMKGTIGNNQMLICCPINYTPM